MTSNLTAEQHKLKGNDYFKTKAYDDAIQEYSTAIVKDPKIAVYYCNRANCYLKLERYSKVVNDCERVVELDPKSVKGYYFLGKAQLELGRPSEAYSVLKRSYDLALEQRSTFTKDIVMILAEAKKQKWIEEERVRLSGVSETYRYLSDLVKQDIQRQMDALDKDASDYEDNAANLRSEKEYRLQQLETLLQRAETPDENVKPYIQRKDPPPEPSLKSKSEDEAPQVEQSQTEVQTKTPLHVREIPDHFLDKITFEFMHDPVISTKSGISYERCTLLEHFSYGRMFDPVSQAPMTERDIVPNRALKEACDDFLSKNGWAIDY